LSHLLFKYGAKAKKHVFGTKGRLQGRAAKLLLARWKSRYYDNALQLTARQYGEVVLPDAAAGQGLGTLAKKLSRCKEGMAHFLPSWYKFY